MEAWCLRDEFCGAGFCVNCGDTPYGPPGRSDVVIVEGGDCDRTLALRTGGTICPGTYEEGGLVAPCPAEDLRGKCMGPGLCNAGSCCLFPGETGLLRGVFTASRRES